MLELGTLVSCELPEGGLHDRLAEVADAIGLPVAFDDGCPTAEGSTLSLTLEATGLPAQGYRLAVTPAGRRTVIRIEAADEAGAFYAIQSLAQLVVLADGGTSVRMAVISDAPSFERRGAIIDPPQLERVRFGVPYKLNFLALASGMPPDIAALVAYCRSHHVEVMSMVGYRDALTRAPIADLKAILTDQHNLGIASFCLKWDDLAIEDPAAMAASHAATFNELYAHLRLLDAGMKVSIVLPPYGGVPGRNLLGGKPAEAYVALMKDRLPPDVVVFWTGDGGVFSATITRDGASAYGSAIGHPLGLWDNDALYFMRGHRPLSGRPADLGAVIGTYMGNMVDTEASWEGGAGHAALLTELQYAWRSETYDSGIACTAASRILGAENVSLSPQPSCVPPGSSATPEIIPRPSPVDIPRPT
jgi:hypothetical protein